MNTRLNGEEIDKMKTEGVVFGNSSHRERKKPSPAALLRSIVQSPVSINIWSLDCDLRYTFFNEGHRRGMERFWGADIRIGDPILDFITSQDYRVVAEEYYRTIFSGTGLALVDELRDPDGGYHYFENHGNPIIDDDGETIGVTVFAVEISDRVKYERELQKTVEEKQTLLKEIHHRVKNNLQIVSSLLSIQSMTIRNASDRLKFIESQNRIQAMASIHEMLYQSENLSRIDMGTYIDSLLAQISDSLVEEDTIELKSEIEPLSVSIDTAVPLGLITTELITNSIKHAFPKGARGRITVSLRNDESGTSEFSIRDNGKGYSGKGSRKRSSLGLQIVDAMVGQINGTFSIRKDHGTVCTVRFMPRG